MGCILTCCIDSSCGWCRGKVAPCYESDIYEAVAAATSESTTVEPGKPDVGATEGHDLQHISNQKMPTGSPEDSLSLKSLPPSEEDNDDVQILPSHVQGSSEDNLSLVCPPPNEDDDGNHDVDEAQISPSSVLGGCYQFDSSCCSSDDNLSLVCLPPSEVDDLDDDDDAQISPSHVQAWPEDRLFLRCSPRCKDEDDDDDDDVSLMAYPGVFLSKDLTLESISDEETYPECLGIMVSSEGIVEDVKSILEGEVALQLSSPVSLTGLTWVKAF
ncbi:aspartate-rich protein 1-like [Theropithecus gelada]|uniref:aspartate-rich protein 1-like n=1 Tax=Theropithecus gelada TaxID=9565 RepID=UPI000DC17364|nr:aspartate-rich protein 1-like [Theropithecus gelada]